VKKVLLVDDDPDILEALELALEGSYEVYPARHGAEALQILERTRVDGIVLDLMMPVMNGGDFLRVLRERGDETPVLVVSAGTDLRARSAAMGADACLPKPFEITDLEAQLARLLGNGGAPEGGSGWGPGGGAPLGGGGHSASPSFAGA
jgi:DNA-binding response OmpR family regulator